MSYLTQAEIADSATMTARVAQCAATQDLGDGVDPDYWTTAHRRTWAASPGWDAAWESSRASHPGQATWDPAADEAVITDQMILSQVQAMVATPPEADAEA